MESITKFNFTTILGWSVSRYDKFTTCLRQYYYDYYAKHDTEYPKHKLDELKKLTSTALETGNIVHDNIKILLERLLKYEGEIDLKRFYDFCYQLTKKYCSQKTFSEVYYGQVPKIDIDAIYNNAQNALNNFLNSHRFLFLTKKAIQSKHEWVIEPGGFGETRIEGLKAYCKVDFLFPVDEKFYILDWKTGRALEQKHKKQLIGYTAWASYHFKKDPGSIVPIIVYLNPAYKEMEVTVTQKDISSFAKDVKNETEEMYAFCENIDGNIPKPKSEFKKTENRRICDYCNYRGLCW